MPTRRRRFTADEPRVAVEAFARSGRTCEDFARLWGCSAVPPDEWTSRDWEGGPKALEDQPSNRRRVPRLRKRWSNERYAPLRDRRLHNGTAAVFWPASEDPRGLSDHGRRVVELEDHRRDAFTRIVRP